MSKNEKIINALLAATGLASIALGSWILHRSREPKIGLDVKAMDYAVKFIDKKIKSGEYENYEDDVLKAKMWDDYQFAKMMYRTWRP